MTTTDTAEYTAVIHTIETAAARLTELLGHRASFGYLGNCDIPGPVRYDDRSWYVFLPHPGRVGTSDDRFGGFSTGDVEGARRTAVEAWAAVRTIKYMRTF